MAIDPNTGLSYGTDLAIGAAVLMGVYLLIRYVYPIWNKYGEKPLQALFDQFALDHKWQVLNQDAITRLGIGVYLRPINFNVDESKYVYTTKTQIAERRGENERIWLVYNQHFISAKDQYRVNSYERTWSFAVLTQFNKTIPGTIKIGPEDKLTKVFRHDLEMESAEFNKKVFVASKPPKLRYAVLPPDFMVWYMGIANKPWITIENNKCYMLLEGEVDRKTLDRFTNEAESIARFIEGSGALQDTT